MIFRNNGGAPRLESRGHVDAAGPAARPDDRLAPDYRLASGPVLSPSCLTLAPAMPHIETKRLLSGVSLG